MLQRINFNHLYYFYVIAQERSLVKAAEKLKVSQPTLSQQLKHFEENLKQDLFDRRGRSLRLNQKGEYLYQHSKDIFATAEKMLIGFNSQLNVGTEEQYKIGVTTSISRNYASSVLHPLLVDDRIGISTYEGKMSSLVAKLYNQELDLVLGEEPDNYLLKEGIEKYHLKETTYYYVCGNHFKFEINDIPNELSGKPYFKYSLGNTIQQKVNAYFYENNITPKVVGESDDLGILIASCEFDNCFALIPDLSADPLIKAGRLKKLGEFEYSKINICGLLVNNRNTENAKKVLDKIKNQYM